MSRPVTDLLGRTVLAIALALAVMALVTDRRRNQVDVNREAEIRAADRAAAALRRESRRMRVGNDIATATVKVLEQRYEQLRRSITIDQRAGTVRTPTMPPTVVPAPALEAITEVIAACDAVVPACSSALDTARAGWSLEAEAADTQLVADSLRDLRPQPPRCGFKCGVAVGASAAAAAIWLGVRIVRAIGAPPATNRPASPPGR